MFKYVFYSLLVLGSIFSCKPQAPLETVSYVDLNRYMGKWYEIALFPQSFEKDCTGTTAEYSLKENGKVSVVNSCYLKTLNGKLKVAEGEASVVDTNTNAKLRVSFFKPFYGDYWVLDLGSNYEYVMVGAPDRNYLWFLSRTPTMDNETYERLKTKAENLGFNVEKLQKTLQVESNE